MESIIPKVAIILINYKNTRDTIECLESVLKLDYPNFNIVIVDNSEDEHLQLALESWAKGAYSVQTLFPKIVYPSVEKPISFVCLTEGDDSFVEGTKITIILAKKNRGFAAGNNIGIRYALKVTDVTLFWLLNNDTIVKREALSSLVRYVIENPAMGIVGSKLLYYNNPAIIQGIGGKYNRWFGIVKEIGRDQNEWDSLNNNQVLDFDYVIGASMLVKKDFLLDVGLMDEDLFLYFEELDWALRAKKKNWKLGCCKESIVYHKQGASINSGIKKHSSILSDYYSIRNRIFITKRHFPYALITLYPSFLIFAFNRIKRKEFKRLSMLLQILMNADKHFRETSFNDRN